VPVRASVRVSPRNPALAQPFEHMGVVFRPHGGHAPAHMSVERRRRDRDVLFDAANLCRPDPPYASARKVASSSATKRSISLRRSRSKRMISAVEQFPNRIQITFGGARKGR